MEVTEFEQQYDCQIQYQYSFDGKKKEYYPIISNLQLIDTVLSLEEFSNYPIIKFHECDFTRLTIVTSRIRDLNFQNCQIYDLGIDIDQIGGTLGFTHCTVSLHSFHCLSSPRIIAFVESELLGLKTPALTGFGNIHTLAILNSGLDYLDLNPLLSQINLEQLIVSEIQSSISLVLDVPVQLHSLKLRNLNLHKFPKFKTKMELEQFNLEGVEITSLEHLDSLEKLRYLEHLEIVNTTITYLPDLNLSTLKILRLDNRIHINDKMMARLKVAGVSLDVV